MKQRLVLLGGSGFIGQSFIRWLGPQGLRARFEIAVLDPKEPQFSEPDHYLNLRIEDTDEIRGFIKEKDVVFHLVHTTIPAESANAPERERKENFEPSKKLVSILKGKRGARLVYFSSGGTIYGEPAVRKPIPESAAPAPGSLYAQTKLAIENLARETGDSSGLEYLIVRPANPYGPFQEILNRHGAVGRIFEDMAQGLVFPVYGQGETVRDYIYIDDFLSALFRILKKDRWGQVFNIGTGTGASLKQLISLCEKVSGKKLTVKHRPMRGTDLKYNVLDRARVSSLGWEPEHTLRRGLRKTWEYFAKKPQ
jgi:UDP-glucose 4-epimerase